MRGPPLSTSPSANSALTMITLTKPMERKGEHDQGARGWRRPPEGDPHPEVTGLTRFLRKPLEKDLFFQTVNEMLDTLAPPERRS